MPDLEPNPSDIVASPAENPNTKGPILDLEVLRDIPEDQTAQEKFQAKKASIASVLDEIIPKESKSREYDKDQIAGHLTGKNIQESEIPGLFKHTYATVLVLNPGEKYFSDIFKGLAAAAETSENAELFSGYAKQWKAKFLEGLPFDDPNDRTRINRIQNFDHVISELTGANRYPRPEPRNPQEMSELFNAFTDLYEVVYTIPNDETNREIIGSLTDYGIRVGLVSHDASQTRKAIQIFKEVADEPDRMLLQRFTNAVLHYGFNHELTEDAVRGLKKKLFTSMKQNDPQVAILNKGGNIWGMSRGDFGIADFVVSSYASAITPSNIIELMMESQEVPATDAGRLDQNRRDGLALAAPFGALRDFIHDQRPYVHDVIQAMVKYYDTNDKQTLQAILNKADPRYLGSEERQDRIFDREQYDREIEETRYHGEGEEPQMMKAINVLRRLEENTKPVEEKPSETSDEILNKYLRKLAGEKTQGRIVKEDLGETFQYVNEQLYEAMKNGEIGIEPNEVLALGWLERRAFDVIHGLSYEGQMAAYKQDWFQQVLKFQELTASPKDFDEEDFDNFIGEVNNSDFQTAYKLIFEREINHISNLTGKYRDEGRENRVSVLWSMNVAHELIGLTDLKPADTEYGKKHRAEIQKPPHVRLTGD